MQTIIPPIPTADRVAFGDSRLSDRFWDKARTNSETGCWEWRGQLTKKGYGVIKFDRRMRRAHRLAYEALIGQVPNGLVLDHLCRVRHCVNPTHLDPVTPAENTRRGVINVGRKGVALKPRTHCPQGHPYDEANTATSHSGKRRCRACTRTRKQQYRQEKRQPRVVSLHKAPLPGTEFVDRNGNVWVADRHNAAGELVLACPNPVNPEDAGEGESYPWTLREVQQAFGPLMARTAAVAA